MLSLTSSLTQHLPAPKYLTMPAVGLDISDDAIKLVELTNTRAGIRIARYDKELLPQGAIVEGVIKNAQQVTQVLTTLKQKHNLQFVHASLPEEHSYLFQADIPAEVAKGQERTNIEFMLKENVPLGPDEAIFDFDVEGVRKNKSRSVTVSVYPRMIVEHYTAVLVDAGLTPLSFETENQSNARAVIPKDSEETIIMVDIGKLGTELAVVRKQKIVFVTSIEVSGDDFTNAIKRFMQVSFEEAEQIKSEKGFIKNDENNDLFEALLGTVSTLRDDINKHLTYWHMHGTHEKNAGGVDKIVLCGGGANLRGFLEYMKATMSVPAELANVWVNVTSFEEYIPPMHKEESLQYATAIGLAMRNLT